MPISAGPTPQLFQCGTGSSTIFVPFCKARLLVACCQKRDTCRAVRRYDTLSRLLFGWSAKLCTFCRGTGGDAPRCAVCLVQHAT
jgi:hypothetical protein